MQGSGETEEREGKERGGGKRGAAGLCFRWRAPLLPRGGQAWQLAWAECCFMTPSPSGGGGAGRLLAGSSQRHPTPPPLGEAGVLLGGWLHACRLDPTPQIFFEQIFVWAPAAAFLAFLLALATPVTPIERRNFMKAR